MPTRLRNIMIPPSQTGQGFGIRFCIDNQHHDVFMPPLKYLHEGRNDAAISDVEVVHFWKDEIHVVVSRHLPFPSMDPMTNNKLASTVKYKELYRIQAHSQVDSCYGNLIQTPDDADLSWVLMTEPLLFCCGFRVNPEVIPSCIAQKDMEGVWTESDAQRSRKTEYGMWKKRHGLANIKREKSAAKNEVGGSSWRG